MRFTSNPSVLGTRSTMPRLVSTKMRTSCFYQSHETKPVSPGQLDGEAEMRSSKHAHPSELVLIPASSKEIRADVRFMFNPHTRKSDLVSAFSLEMEADS